MSADADDFERDFRKLPSRDEYMYECPRCSIARRLNSHQEYASFSRDLAVIEAAALRHAKQTGHTVEIHYKKFVKEVSP